MKYVALLRGINVGGNSKIEMSRLKAVFESLGHSEVVTYINSGNVIFVSDEPESELVAKIERAITREFNLSVPVIVRDKTNIEALVRSIPDDWNNQEQKTDVMFLWNAIDSSDILNKITAKPELGETIRYEKGALLWNIDRKNVTKSAVLRLVGTPVYKQMTVRNVNTVRKIAMLME